ncbi:hypothetical protein RHGRI_018994 [Rhododendron griersonianum]|uniref:WRKY domain-containing protein n=1 Tax=Rhododendron griersonianum TaxID=479676 RepID=A0AAV6JF35_9ERIC|nr:hypothetical protein RHGRI_018994 [Rhododendron griersonianum]
MEKIRGWEQETLVKELHQGYELTKQLKHHIGPLTSPESCEFLVHKIISTYDRALSILNFGDSAGEFQQVAGTFEPPQPLTGGSPMSEASDQCHKDAYKKRKTSPRWTEQVRVCSGKGTGDDGYTWRKYGQKDILGANFPRAYYRCTHRHVQGCLATKQVQKSDADPSIAEITYRGRHTCIQSPALASSGKEFAKQKKDQCQPHLLEENQIPLFNFGTGFKTEEMGIMEETFPSFSFPSSPSKSQNVETISFLEPLKEKNFLGSDSLEFLSLLEFPIDNFGFGEDLQLSESDLSEIISAPTSVTNSPTGNLDFFSLDQVDFDPNFQFDTSEFFS